MFIFVACGKSQGAGDGQLGDIAVDKESSYSVDGNDENLSVTEDRKLQDENNTEENPVSSPAENNSEPDNNTKAKSVTKETFPPKSKLELEIEKLNPEDLYKWYKTNIFDAWSDDATYLEKKSDYYLYVSARMVNDKEFNEYVEKNRSDPDFDAGFVYEVNLKNAKDLEQRFKEAEEKQKQLNQEPKDEGESENTQADVQPENSVTKEN